MRTTTVTALLLALLLSALPASAQTEPLQPCTGSEAPLTLEGAQATVEGPVGPQLGTATLSYRLDLSGQEVVEGVAPDDRAAVTVDMSWLSPLDYDLEVNGLASQGLQPVDASEESVTVSNVRHCAVVTITITNFAAPGVEAIDLDTRVRL